MNAKKRIEKMKFHRRLVGESKAEFERVRVLYGKQSPEAKALREMMRIDSICVNVEEVHGQNARRGFDSCEQVLEVGRIVSL